VIKTAQKGAAEPPSPECVLCFVLERNREVERARVMEIEREGGLRSTKSTTKREICGGFAASTHLLAPTSCIASSHSGTASMSPVGLSRKGFHLNLGFPS
jgi:hypothetical protein